MIEVRPLRASDDRTLFHSGNPDLDRFFAKYAGQNQFRHHVGVTWIAVEDESVLGFATVSPSQIEIDDLPEGMRGRLPRYPLPVLRLARLATDTNARGRGVGSVLLRTVFGLARELSGTVGCIGVVVDAKPEAVQFYEKLGFRALASRSGALGDRPEPLPMFVHLGSIPFP